MASFDFIEASSKGYEFFWTNRSYLMRVAVPVIFVKIICLLSVFVLGADKMYLRQGLILLPGNFAEALFIIGLIRYALYQEPIFIWGKLIPPPEKAVPFPSFQGPLTKKQCVLGGIIMYMLLKVIQVGLMAWVLDSVEIPDAPSLEQGGDIPPLLNAFIVFCMLASFMWMFRLLWLYIPITMGYPFTMFLKRIAGLQSSIYMVATWLICFLPLIVFFIASLQLFAGGFPEGSVPQVLISTFIQAVAEIIMISVQVIAMTYGFVEILKTKIEET